MLRLPRSRGLLGVAVVSVSVARTPYTNVECFIRMVLVRSHLSRTCWQPRWQNPHGWSPNASEGDGWWDFAGTVPVIATYLDQLRTHGPRALVWWRFGHSDWQPITDALTDNGTEGEYRVREEQQSLEREAQEERRRQEREEELRRREAGKWECPSCGGPVYPGVAWGAPVAPGGLCTVCRTLTDSQQPQTAERTVSVGGCRDQRGPDPPALQ
ncbi:hypothetical protein ACFCX0_36005 [Streptomyces sp. NPDC056352]|uniref:hypothetical protein n=1 Tax=Streptomyces sp. NPDC056352 TaxID=3345791 RepID=UPI0035E23961